MLYIVGLGLDEKDISLKGIDVLKKCSAVYCEFYTSKWGDIKGVENTIKKKIKQLNREEVESDYLVNEAKKKTIALLVPGDSLTATTHFQLFIDAKNAGIIGKMHGDKMLNTPPKNAIKNEIDNERWVV